MIVNRGATQAALERWNERRRRIFYPKTDIDFDLEALRKRKAELSKIDLSKVANILEEEVQSIELLLNAGTFHALFRVQTRDKSWILKLSAEETDPGFALECEAMAFLRGHSRSLKIAAHEIVPQSLPCPFLIIEQALGQPLTQFEDPQTQAVAEPLLFEFGREMARFHRLKRQGAGLLGWIDSRDVGLLPKWDDYIVLRLDEHIGVCRSIGAISDVEQGEIVRRFSTFSGSGIEMRLLHGDPGHHNVFADGQKITAIIDWEDSLSGDPIFDIAYWGTFVRDEMRARFLEGYQTVEKLPADFEYRYWLYYLRIALSKTVHRHRFGTRDRPGRPPASLRIQKALSKLAEL